MNKLLDELSSLEQRTNAILESKPMHFLEAVTRGDNATSRSNKLRSYHAAQRLYDNPLIRARIESVDDTNDEPNYIAPHVVFRAKAKRLKREKEAAQAALLPVESKPVKAGYAEPASTWKKIGKTVDSIGEGISFLFGAAFFIGIFGWAVYDCSGYFRTKFNVYSSSGDAQNDFVGASFHHDYPDTRNTLYINDGSIIHPCPEADSTSLIDEDCDGFPDKIYTTCFELVRTSQTEPLFKTADRLWNEYKEKLGINKAQRDGKFPLIVCAEKTRRIDSCVKAHCNMEDEICTKNAKTICE